ncbi:MAG: hypothetical protein ACOCV2_15065 [Persicimonas sp.]
MSTLIERTFGVSDDDNEDLVTYVDDQYGEHAEVREWMRKLECAPS